MEMHKILKGLGEPQGKIRRALLKFWIITLSDTSYSFYRRPFIKILAMDLRKQTINHCQWHK